uniref:Metalloendopeptidase n=1 Tax=Parastrongyloides trichosuri TaxID=131310 RepID=A0A0N5A2Y3_PARTI
MVLKSLLIIFLLLFDLIESTSKTKNNKAYTNTTEIMEHEENIMMLLPTDYLFWKLPIPYYIEDIVYKHVVKRAISNIEEKTCLVFDYHKILPKDHYNFMIIRTNDSIFTPYKVFNGKYQVEINTTCLKYYTCVLKSIAISLGLMPPHERLDRKEYIDIKWEHMDPKYRASFIKINKSGQKRLTSCIPYEYGSLLHPNRYFGSSSGEETIVVKKRDCSVLIAEKNDLTFYDIKFMNDLYCKSSCIGYDNKCKNEGYLNPNNCLTCICPSGYSGSYCEEIKGKCRSYPKEMYVEEDGELLLNGTNNCYVLIKTDLQHRIKLYIEELFINTYRACEQGYEIEIRHLKSKAHSGASFCHTLQKDNRHYHSFTSENNEIMLHIDIRRGDTGKIRYKII